MEAEVTGEVKNSEDPPLPVKKKKSSKKSESLKEDVDANKVKKVKKKSSSMIKPPSSLPPPLPLAPPPTFDEIKDLPPPPIMRKKTSSSTSMKKKTSSNEKTKDQEDEMIPSPSRAPPPPPNIVQVEQEKEIGLHREQIKEEGQSDELSGSSLFVVPSPPRNIRATSSPSTTNTLISSSITTSSINKATPIMIVDKNSNNNMKNPKQTNFELEIEDDQPELEEEDDADEGEIISKQFLIEKKNKINTTKKMKHQSLLFRSQNEECRSKLYTQLEGQGLNWKPWNQIEFKPQIEDNSKLNNNNNEKEEIEIEENFNEEMDKKFVGIELDWVVDIKLKNNLNNQNEFAIATAWKYYENQEKNSKNSVKNEKQIINQDNVLSELSVSFPDRISPEWEGSIPLKTTWESWECDMKLIECCDDPGSLSSLLFSTHLRENLVPISWEVEWAPLSVDPASEGHMRIGIARWLSRSTNQLLIISDNHMPEVVEIDVLVTLISVSKAFSDNETARESDQLFWSLAQSGLVNVVPGLQPPQTHNETPLELARDQLELLMHYEHGMRSIADQALYDRDMAIRDQENVMQHLHRFVFEGDLMQGHKVLELLSHRAADPNLRYKLNSDGILKHVAQIEEDLWHVLDSPATDSQDETKKQLIEIGGKVKVLYRGKFWENAQVIGKNDENGSYDVELDQDSEVVKGVTEEHLEALSSSSDRDELNPISSSSSSSLPLWLQEERKRVQSELSKRTQQRQALEGLMKQLDSARLEAQSINKQDHHDIAAPGNRLISEPWDGSRNPVIGDQVAVYFGNGSFLGKVLRISPTNQYGLLYDVGFSGEHVEINLPISRLGIPSTLLSIEEKKQQILLDHSFSSGGVDHIDETLKSGNLRVVCLSLNMSHREFQHHSNDSGTVNEDNDDLFGFNDWVCPNGVFESVAIENLHEQADIIFVSLQDVPSDFQKPREVIETQLSGSFNLCGWVYRFKGQLQSLLFVRSSLIPPEGLMALSPKSSAITLGPDATIDDDEEVISATTSEVQPVGCVGGLLFTITVKGVKFCFASVRLSLGLEAEEKRKLELSQIIEGARLLTKKMSTNPLDDVPADGNRKQEQIEKKKEEKKGEEELDIFQHLFVLGDLGSRVKPAPVAKKASLSPVKTPQSGPALWRHLYSLDELHCQLGDGYFPGFITPGCDQFPPISEPSAGHSSTHEGKWPAHFGPRCLVRSAAQSMENIICREYLYLPLNPTAVPDEICSKPPCPQLPLRACFHVAF